MNINYSSCFVWALPCLLASSQVALANENKPKHSYQDSVTNRPEFDQTPMDTRWGLGLSLGLTSGVGICARRHFANRWGVHVSGFYFYIPKDGQWGNLGGQALYTISRRQKTRFYGLWGARIGFLHTFEADTSPAPTPADPTQKSSAMTTTLFTGPGIGFEVHFNKRIGWSFELPATIAITLDGDKDHLPFGGLVNFFPGANTALTFYF